MSHDTNSSAGVSAAGAAAIGIRLDELFPAARQTGTAAATVRHCTADWRRVQPGDAYVAIVGADADGHDYVDQAVKRGAAAIVAEQLVPARGVPVYVVEDTRIAMGELCHALVGHPSRQLRVVGVVGDAGKSSVVALLESIFTKAGCHVGVLSTLNSYDGQSFGLGVDETLTTAALASRLAHMDAAGCTHALVEISSQALAQHKLAGVELDTVVATRIDATRLDVHNSVQNYRDAQRRVIDLLSPAGLAIVDADDPVACRWLATLDAASLTYGLDDRAQVTAEIIERGACETVFVLIAGCESAAVRTTIVGDAHVTNCLAATAVALSHGLDLTAIAAGIEAVDRLPARMERIDCGQDFAVFVDAAKTAPALQATLRTARQLSRGRVICVLGEAPSSPAEATVVRSIVAKLADLTILTDAVGEEADWPIPAADASDFQIAADRGEAIAWAAAIAEPGDVVVIAGSRGPTECGFGAAEITEADAVREVLYARGERQFRLVG
jgi:UDP-N-acetylmuramoyl-L-alanyl-D-glutamate--2,6-diaminopimelate ligase